MLKARVRALFDRCVLTKAVELDSERFIKALEEVRLDTEAPKIVVRESNEPVAGSYLVIDGNYRAVAHACIGRQPRLFPIRSRREIDVLMKEGAVAKTLPFRDSVLGGKRNARGAILDEALISAARRLNFRTAQDLAQEYCSLSEFTSVAAPIIECVEIVGTELKKFVDLFPWMENNPGRIDQAFLSTRLAKCFRENRISNWSDLGGLSPLELSAWDRIGTKSITILLEFLEKRSREVPVEFFSDRKVHPANDGSNGKGTQIITESDVSPISLSSSRASQMALQTLSQYAAYFPKTKTLRQILEVPEEDLPFEVALAVKQLLEFDLATVITESGSHPNLDDLIKAFLQEFSPVDLDIFFDRRPPGKRTLQSIGTELNLTRERVRQLDAATHQRIGLLLESQRYMPIKWVSELLRIRMGTEFHSNCEQWRDANRELIPKVSGVTKERVQKLLLFVAGPYELDTKTQWHSLCPVPKRGGRLLVTPKRLRPGFPCVEILPRDHPVGFLLTGTFPLDE